VFSGNSATGLRNGTATLVREQGRLFIVTAYHNLYDKTDASFGVIKREGGLANPIELGNNTYLDETYFYDAINDLAVLSIKPAEEPRFLADFPDITPIELFDGNLTNAAGDAPKGVPGDAPKGVPGISIGNPRVREVSGPDYSPENVVYSCTIAEYEVADKRFRAALDKGYPLSEAAANNRWLFVEAMSIAEGFSGGPVIVTQTVLENGKPAQVYRLAGIVSGGTPLIRPGRFAWASRASAIRTAIDGLKSPAAPGPITEPAGKLKGFPPKEVVIGNRVERWPKMAYSTQHAYTFDHKRFFRDKTLGGDYARKVLTNEYAHELIFEDCTFLADAFSADPGGGGYYLVNATFNRCKFKPGVKFDRAILSGAVFHDCEPDTELQKLLEPSLSHGAALFRGAHQVVRTPASEKVEAIESELRDFADTSRLALAREVNARPPDLPPVPPPMPAPPAGAEAEPARGYRALIEQEKRNYRNILKGAVEGP
jgi:hypothetical protein